jgi:hypothetical protein
MLWNLQDKKYFINTIHTTKYKSIERETPERLLR